MKNKNYFNTFYDLAFGLLFIFILISSLYKNDFEKVSSILEKETQRKTIEMKKRRYQFYINEKALFNSGESDFRDKKLAESFIREAIDTIYNRLLSDSIELSQIKSIIIIGHTDNQPINLSMKIRKNNINYSNWNLSLDRANSIVDLIIEKKILEGKSGLYENLLLPAGKAWNFPHKENVKEFLFANNININENFDFDSFYTSISKDTINFKKFIDFCNSTEEKRKLNRRIEIKVEL